MMPGGTFSKTLVSCSPSDVAEDAVVSGTLTSVDPRIIFSCLVPTAFAAAAA